MIKSISAAAVIAVISTQGNAAEYVYRQESGIDLPSVKPPPGIIRSFSVSPSGTPVSAMFVADLAQVITDSGEVDFVDHYKANAEGMQFKITGVPGNYTFDESVPQYDIDTVFAGTTSYLGNNGGDAAIIAHLSLGGPPKAVVFTAPYDARAHLARGPGQTVYAAVSRQIDAGGLRQSTILQLDKDLQPLWSKDFDNSPSNITALASAGGSSVYAVGFSQDGSYTFHAHKIDSSGSMLWSKGYDIYTDVPIDSVELGGDLYVLAQMTSGSMLNTLYRIDGSTGEPVWGVRFEVNRSLVASGSGEIAILGRSTADYSVWGLIRINANGGLISSHQIDWPSNVLPQAIDYDDSGELMIVGGGHMMTLDPSTNIVGDYGQFVVSASSATLTSRAGNGAVNDSTVFAAGDGQQPVLVDPAPFSAMVAPSVQPCCALIE